MKKYILWLLKRRDRGTQKEVVLEMLNDILLSTDSNIDNATAEKIITLAIKSQGNGIISFIVKD